MAKPEWQKYGGRNFFCVAYTGNVSQKIFVGNLPHAATEDYIRELFEESRFRVEQVMIMKNPETGRTRGFAFVTLADGVDGKAVIAALDGQSFMGSHLAVNFVTPKPEPKWGPRRQG